MSKIESMSVYNVMQPINLKTASISAIGQPQSDPKIQFDLQAAGFESLIDLMINAININKDNPAVVASCKNTILLLISKCKDIAPLLSDRYQAFVQKVSSYTSADDLINNWSNLWTKDLVTSINSDMNDWKKNNPTDAAENCNSETLFGILLFESDATKFGLPGATQIFGPDSGPSTNGQDFAAFILFNLWHLNESPLLYQTGSAFAQSPPFTADDIETIVAALSYSSNGAPYNSFYPFADQLITLFNQLHSSYPAWPNDQYPIENMIDRAISDWKIYIGQ